ncbi:AAA family ATPase [Microbacterium sp. CFBP 13617]|uniref:KAP family P-loop NTPase fold protein n=1 Tax=Microbacterium sp. CFBP 13617 TaxID=2774035 RepID=UPI0017846BCF|nr:P-loop NTPase fold protein [Microbacterium sp. CFBP 13617]MBD8219565.1 AAA family ATPase [Microbacterium sp. CFBP 13617]
MGDLSETWLSDDPLPQLDDHEAFRRVHLVDHVLSVLGRLRHQSASSTIGLVGAWGSGKTTVLDELARRLSDREQTRQFFGEEWSVAHFNPWLYSDPASLHAAFFAELKNAIPKERRWKEPRQALTTFGRKLTPLIATGQVFGYNGVSAYGGLLDQIEPSTTARQKTTAEAMRKLGRPVLMIIDDLDRLSAGELLHVFKLVRMVGRLPNVYYLLSYDERSLIDLLSKTDLVADAQGRRGLDYLEKMIQVRLDMPLLRDYEVDRVVSRALNDIVKRHQIGLEPAELSRLVNRFDGVMSSRLRTPRAAKRVFGQLDAFLSSVGREVDFGDFVVLTWLRTIEPGVYGMLQTYKSEVLGHGGDPLRNLRRPKRTNEDARKQWEERLAATHVTEEHVDDILYLLASLFPHLEEIYEGDAAKVGKDRNPPPVRAGRIAHPDYFDRYFQFGVPDDDIADATIRLAVDDLRKNQTGPALIALERAFAAQPELVLRKLSQFSEDDGLDHRSVASWLSDRYGGTDPSDFLDRRIESLIAEILTLAPPDDAVGFVASQLGTDEGLYLGASVRHRLAEVQIGPSVRIDAAHALAEALTPVILAALQSRFEQLREAVDTPLDASLTLNYLLWMWRQLDRVGVRDYLATARETGRWTLLDELAWFVSGGGSDEEVYISRFSDFGDAVDVLDIDQAYVELRDEIAVAPTVESLHNMLATPDNRRLFVLASLRRSQERRQTMQSEKERA